MDLGALRAQGWRPTPFREYVLKMCQRCNLACSYCYMYEMADHGWREKPVRMSRPTVDAVAHRIAEHAGRHGLARIKVLFHGGEPLLAGATELAATATLIRNAVPASTEVEFGVQTNGVLLTEDALRTFLVQRIRVGVSVDGGAAQHDRHRRFRGRRGSYEAVAAALELLTRPPYREIFSGLLCTIDLGNDPVETYRALLGFEPPAVDLLLPHGNWTNPPPGREVTESATPYADWLITVFDLWYSASPRPTEVRLFDEILNLILGRPSRIESVGLSPVGLIVVDTDGSIEQVDALRSAYHGAAGLRLDVFSDSFDTALAHPAIAARQIGAAALSDTCRACAVQGVCGAGFYPHRYRAGDGYRNPSVYCPDLLRLITHIGRRVRRDTLELFGS